MTRLTSHPLARFIGAGTLAFGVLGLVRPDVLARMAGADEETARQLGVRDLTNGLLLLASGDPRPALAQRVFSDVSDAVMFGRRKPNVAVAALGFGALGVVALVRGG